MANHNHRPSEEIFPALLALLLSLLLVSHVTNLSPLPTATIPTTRLYPSSSSSTPKPKTTTPLTRYAKLATLYLSPYPAPQTQNLTLSLLKTLYACPTCFLLQLRNTAVYIHDPHFQRVQTPFRELRMREAIHWTRLAIPHLPHPTLDLVISVADGVPFTNYNHSYRMPRPTHITPVPVFTVSRCNISHAIPFPMLLADVLRRAMPNRFWHRPGGFLKEWDQTTQLVARGALPWNEKISKAVFRGSVRVSAHLGSRDAFHHTCHSVGRTGLWKRAREHVERVRSIAERDTARRTTWPLPASWFVREGREVLDVEVDGVCGERIYVSDGMRLPEQGRFKYVIHAEGNSFWADRLLLLLFGDSAVLKQETPCGMFFEPLLRPYVEYVPVDYAFRHLVRQTVWMKQNDAVVRGIVRNANAFARDFLSVEGVQTYVDQLLVQYQKLMRGAKADIVVGAVQLFP